MHKFIWVYLRKRNLVIMRQKKSRRDFLLTGSKILVGTFGIITLGKHFTFSQIKEIPETKINKNLHEQQKEKRILIAFDSKFGSTAEIAEFIGKHIPGGNQHVDVKEIEDIEDLSSYNQVIIGSAIQYNKWLPAAREFVIKHEKELCTKSVSFFLVCLTLARNNEKGIQESTAYSKEIESLVPNVKVQNFGKFAGVLDYSKMSFVQRILAKGIFLILGIKDGDYRDWVAIENWAKSLTLT